MIQMRAGRVYPSGQSCFLGRVVNDGDVQVVAAQQEGLIGARFHFSGTNAKMLCGIGERLQRHQATTIGVGGGGRGTNKRPRADPEFAHRHVNATLRLERFVGNRVRPTRLRFQHDAVLPAPLTNPSVMGFYNQLANRRAQVQKKTPLLLANRHVHTVFGRAVVVDLHQNR